MSDQFPPNLPPDEADPTLGEQPDVPEGFGDDFELADVDFGDDFELADVDFGDAFEAEDVDFGDAFEADATEDTAEAEIAALQAELDAGESEIPAPAPATQREIAKVRAARAAKAASAPLEVADFAGLAAPFGRVTDAASLAAVLNAALQLDVAAHPKHKAKPVSAKLLNYYAYHKKETRYRTFQIPKRTRGEVRTIKAPDHGLLRLQRLLLACLTATFTGSHAASHGFVPGRSVLTNAQPHAGHRFVLNLDVRNFFPSTSIGRVVAVLQLAPFNLAKEAAYLIANLCCDQGCLPQGAPTSPLLTNAVCQRLDRRLQQLADRHRCTYTRYADDLTFSCNRPVFRDRFHQELTATLTAEGYELNEQKQRLQTPETRQEVTGIVVNERPNVPREYVRQIRAMLHNWETKGYEAATATLRQHYPASKAHARHQGKVPKLERVLAGKIAYLGMVRGKEDSGYSTYLAKLKALNKNRIIESLRTVTKIWQEQGLNAAIQSNIL